MPTQYSKKFLKAFIHMPLCLAITACGGGGGGGGGEESPQESVSNTAPQAVNDTVTTSNRVADITIDVLANDSDSDGDALSITAVETSTQGIAPTIENGEIRYTLPENFVGTDEFTYTISDGEAEASATVSVTINSALTVSGLIGETVSGTGSVSVMVGNQSYTATLDGSRFSLDIPDTLPDDVVSVRAEFSQTGIGKPVVLKSYAGFISQLSELAVNGAVSESEQPALYLSAASTSAAAIIERAAGSEPSIAAELIEASQVLPQELVVEGAIAFKSILAGDSWDTFTQQDTYSLLEDYPGAIEIAESLHGQDATKYEEYRSAVVGDEKQAAPVTGYDGTALLFVEGAPDLNRPSGFVLQLTGEASGEGYLATSTLTKGEDNSVSFSLSGLETTIDTSGLFPSVSFSDNREVCAPDLNGSYSATPTKKTLRKYLDSGAFSAYQVIDTYDCDATTGTFDGEPRFVQLNAFTSGDIQSLTQSTFAIGTYLYRDPSIYSGPYLWQSVLVEPNSSGTVTQRFDFNSGYTDSGAISYPDGERMVLNMNRGDYIEYTPLGMDGVALRTLGVLKRADGSPASVGGDFLVPATSGVTMPLPSKLVYADPVFAISDANSAYYAWGFGFEFLADNTGYQLYRPDGSYERSPTGFSWAQADGYLDMRYYANRADYTFPTNCAEGDPDCVEWRFRELEVLSEDNGSYFIRVYQEADNSILDGQTPGTDVFSSSYIDRFSVTP